MKYHRISSLWGRVTISATIVALAATFCILPSEGKNWLSRRDDTAGPTPEQIQAQLYQIQQQLTQLQAQMTQLQIQLNQKGTPRTEVRPVRVTQAPPEHHHFGEQHPFRETTDETPELIRHAPIEVEKKAQAEPAAPLLERVQPSQPAQSQNQKPQPQRPEHLALLRPAAPAHESQALPAAKMPPLTEKTMAPEKAKHSPSAAKEKSNLAQDLKPEAKQEVKQDVKEEAHSARLLPDLFLPGKHREKARKDKSMTASEMKLSEAGKAAEAARTETTTSKVVPSNKPRVRASVVIKAPPEVVWNAVHEERKTDPDLAYSKVLRQGVNESTMEQKFVLIPVIGTAVCVMNTSEVPLRRIDYQLVKSDRFKAMEGSWILTPSADGKTTTLELSSHIDLGLPVPRGMMNGIAEKKLQRRLNHVKEMAENNHARIAGKGAPQ
ncbi:MAG TPA: SRPBCC family protein [Candidatus Obscuribacterales bacterium]